MAGRFCNRAHKFAPPAVSFLPCAVSCIDGRLVNLSDCWNPGGQLDAKSLHNGQRCLQGGLPLKCPSLFGCRGRDCGLGAFPPVANQADKPQKCRQQQCQRKSERKRKLVTLISATLAAPATNSAAKVPRSRVSGRRQATSIVSAPVATINPPMTLNTWPSHRSRPGAAERIASSERPIKRGSSGSNAGRSKTKYIPNATSQMPLARNSFAARFKFSLVKVSFKRAPRANAVR